MLNKHSRGRDREGEINGKRRRRARSGVTTVSAGSKFLSETSVVQGASSQGQHMNRRLWSGATYE
jgi:hypothetical protein